MSCVRAPILEDVREADILLKSYGHDCDRITHNELLASSGTEYTGKLLKGDYDLLWISSPHNWETVQENSNTLATHSQLAGKSNGVWDDLCIIRTSWFPM